MIHRIRLRNGIEVINGITGETAPTYGEYVLAEDYDAVLDALNGCLSALERIRESHEIHTSAEDAARAAIAKATGAA